MWLEQTREHTVDEDYERLRDELEAAYAAPVWDSGRIDRIAAEMARVEHALAGGASDVSPECTP